MLKLDYEVNKPTFKYVESLWFDYHDMIIKMRDIELDTHIEEDVNADIKAKGLTSDPTARQAFRKDYARQNGKYRTLEKYVTVIEEIYNGLNDDYKKVARARYFTKHSESWEKISQETDYSRVHAIRIRNAIIKETAKKLEL